MSWRRLLYGSEKMNVQDRQAPPAKTGDSPSGRKWGQSLGGSRRTLAGTVPILRPTRRGTVPVFALLLTLLLVGTASASLCVWRQPDADISGIFGSGSYKTVFVDITDAQKLKIEKRLGFSLDADETQFKYFPVYKGKQRVGTVMTHAGKGQFGAIEVVVAVVEGDSGPVIKEVRIQRDREKAKAALRGKEFLGQFKGKGLTDAFKVGDDLKTAVQGADKASQAVATAARKLLLVYDELGRP
jgi:hypothetical protein